MQIVRSVTFLSLLVAGVCSVIVSGPGRALFVAFSVAAWSHLLWAYILGTFESDRPTLPTTLLIKYLWTLSRVEDPIAADTNIYSFSGSRYVPDWNLFAEVGILILTLLLGLIAAAIAWCIGKGNDTSASDAELEPLHAPKRATKLHSLSARR